MHDQTQLQLVNSYIVQCVGNGLLQNFSLTEEQMNTKVIRLAYYHMFTSIMASLYVREIANQITEAVSRESTDDNTIRKYIEGKIAALFIIFDEAIKQLANNNAVSISIWIGGQYIIQFTQTLEDQRFLKIDYFPKHDVSSVMVYGIQSSIWVNTIATTFPPFLRLCCIIPYQNLILPDSLKKKALSITDFSNIADMTNIINLFAKLDSNALELCIIQYLKSSFDHSMIIEFFFTTGGTLDQLLNSWIEQNINTDTLLDIMIKIYPDLNLNIDEMARFILKIKPDSTVSRVIDLLLNIDIKIFPDLNLTEEKARFISQIIKPDSTISSLTDLLSIKQSLSTDNNVIQNDMRVHSSVSFSNMSNLKNNGSLNVTVLNNPHIEVGYTSLHHQKQPSRY